MESFSRKVLGENSIPVENLKFFDNFRGWGSAEVNQFAQNHFILEVPLNWLNHTFSSKSDDILILAPICLNLVFR